jgi:hypothetical protein
MNPLSESKTSELFKNFHQCMNELSSFQSDKFKYLVSVIDELKSIQETLQHKIDKDVKLIEMIDGYKNEIQQLKEDNQCLRDEMTNLKKVSVVSNLNKQLHEKNSIIEQQNKLIEFLKKQTSPKHAWVIEDTPNNIRKSDEVKVNKEPQLVVVKNTEHKGVGNKEEYETNETNEPIELIIERVDTVVENEEQKNDEKIENEELEENENDSDDIEIEYEVVKIGKKYFYRSNEEINGIYEVIKKTNEVGKKLGMYQNNKATFF